MSHASCHAETAPENWPEREELRRWLVQVVAPQAAGQPGTFRLTTSDGVRWLAETTRDPDGVVRVRMYWESRDDPARRTHEWDAEVEGGRIRWPLGED
jgi:hypothetical protein